MIEGKRIFMTGGAGFIGSTLVNRLIARNRITVFDNMARDALSRTAAAGHRNLTVTRGDVLDLEGLKRAMAGHDLVIHAAGIAGINTVIIKPVLTMRVNMVGSANVLEAAAQLDACGRVVCFSTSEVFGQHAIGSSESDKAVIGSAGEARWTYAVSKLAEEHLALAYHKEAGLPTVVLRPFNIYGPHQVGEGAIRIFIEQALRDEEIVIYGDGTQIRAWCYVDDMVQGTLLATTLPAAIGESFNIGNIRSVVTIYGLANTVIRVLGSKSTIRFADPISADVQLRIPSVDKAREMLGFAAKVDLEEGISRTAEVARMSPR